MSAGVCSLVLSVAALVGPSAADNNMEWTDAQNRWLLRGSINEGLTFFGLDSEGTGREQTNLLAGPVALTWTDADSLAVTRLKTGGECRCTIPSKDGRGKVDWTVSNLGEDLVWKLEYAGPGSAEALSFELPFNALMAGAVLIPSGLDSEGRGLGPWLLVAPDFGHLVVEVDSPVAWHGANTGTRGWSAQNAPMTGVNPRLRGQAWLDATKLPDFHRGTLRLQFTCSAGLPAHSPATLRFRPVELTRPDGIDPALWKRIRRPYLNHWQPCGTWAGPGMSYVLANNVLSDPASCSLWFYAEPMLFWHEPVKGVAVAGLLRRSLDYWLDCGVSAQGHVNAFGKMYDLYVVTGTSLIVSAWDYWALTGDTEWLTAPAGGARRIEVLQRMADYLLRRDMDGDGLIESIHSGNAGSLRDPDRADIWFEMMNFGWKNSWTNLLSYRAFLCLAEMLDAVGQPDGAQYYRRHAERLCQAFVGQMLGRNGWFVSWISQDGNVHDYCHTFINGMAVAYGIVPPEQGQQILSRVVAQSKSIGFNCWHLGVPGNLISCPPEDLIRPRIGLDGKPILNTFGVEDPAFWDKDLFGYRYPNGTIHPALVWPYLLGLQVAGLNEEADRILNAMLQSAEDGLFQNGIVNVGYGGAEHFYINGNTCGYEGYLPESFNFLMAAFTRDPKMRQKLLRPMTTAGNHDVSGHNP